MRHEPRPHARPWRRRRLLVGLAAATVAIGASLPLAAAGVAGAARPACDPDTMDCPGVPDVDDEPIDPTQPPPPTPQPRPPAPYGNAEQFTYGQLALATDAALIAGLQAPLPPGNEPFPLPSPFSPEKAGAPVRVQSLGDGMWAFSSFDADGMATFCTGHCTTVPEVVYNPNYGTYQATLRVEPRLDVELWKVTQLPSPFGPPRPVAVRMAEITARLHLRAYAECVGWETQTGRLRAFVGAGNVTISRDTGVLEDIGNFFDPTLTSGINRQLRDTLMAQLQVGRYDPLPMHGGACTTLGVAGDAASGAIRWNPTCTTIVCQVTGGGPIGGPGDHVLTPV